MPDASQGPAFDLHQIPFSHHGSWFDISPVTGQHTRAEDLHLVSHQNGMHPVLRLTAPAGAQWLAVPGQLSWLATGGRNDLAYETPDTVRLRGQGLGLRVTAAAPVLTPFSGTYFYRDPLDGAYTFTSYETGRRYRVTVLAGTAEAFAGFRALQPRPFVPRRSASSCAAAVRDHGTASRAPLRSKS